jgi:DNA repair protein RadC
MAISCAADGAAMVRPIFRRWKWEQETFVVMLLNSQHAVIGKPQIIAVGSVSSVEVHPRDVFRAAIRKNASAIILAHCHPSGDVTPSTADIELTWRLKAAADLLGIVLLDHIIVAKEKLRSLSEHGEL